MVVQLKGVWSYNYRVYGCTTIRVVVVRLKGVATRLSRPAEPSGNLREAVSFNLRNYLFKLKETSPWTQRDVSFSQLSRYILSNKVPHSSYEYTSSSQRSRIYKPAQPYLGASTAVCSDSMKRKNSCYEVHGFISLLQSPNLLNRFFFDSVVTSATHAITLWL